MSGLSPRVRQLQHEIVVAIPCGTKAHRAHLAELPFPTIMNIYINYASRLVVPRPRRVVFAPNFWEINGARQDGSLIRTIAAEISAGANLSPRLSSLVRFRGYRPDRYDENGCFIGNKWWSRDFALNVYGLHHLHLDTIETPKAKRDRSARLVFVEFSRDIGLMVMVGGHDFDSTQLEERILRLRANNEALVLTGIVGIEWGATHRRNVSRQRAPVYPLVQSSSARLL
jgi:hypothetical protein